MPVGRRGGLDSGFGPYGAGLCLRYWDPASPCAVLFGTLRDTTQPGGKRGWCESQKIGGSRSPTYAVTRDDPSRPARWLPADFRRRPRSGRSHKK